ncbi:hypothetical protein RF11_10014 [Thelohanellus kitauei]|uniref:Uncharacterized protein n=1 Tax=Thelohanellus kitauei TaxID=669202 RepID=A0A0C2J3A3_THEKT|nr:hypothetical protein RF11_10014 [Thelohanellus kitauei]
MSEIFKSVSNIFIISQRFLFNFERLTQGLDGLNELSENISEEIKILPNVENGFNDIILTELDEKLLFESLINIEVFFVFYLDQKQLQNDLGFNSVDIKKYYQEISLPIFRLFQDLKFIRSILLIISISRFMPIKRSFVIIKRIILFLCACHEKRYFIGTDYESLNLLTTLLISDTIFDSQFYAYPLTYLLSSYQTLDECTWSHVGLHIIFAFQIVQMYDHLKALNAQNKDLSLSLMPILHQCVNFMSSDIGESSVIEFFTRGCHILPLISLIKNRQGEDKYSPSTSVNIYASFIVRRILQNFESTEFIIENITYLNSWVNRESSPHLCEVMGWLMAIKNLKSFNLQSSFLLINFVIQALDEFQYNIHAVRATSTALRLLVSLHFNHKIDSEHVSPSLCSSNSIINLMEFNVIEMMQKYISKLRVVLENKGFIRNNFTYIFAIYRGILPFLNLNQILFVVFKSIDTFPYNDEFIVDMICLNSSIQDLKYFPFCESIKEVQQIILVFLASLFQSSLRNETLGAILLHFSKNFEDLPSNVSLFYKLILLFFTNQQVLLFNIVSLVLQCSQKEKIEELKNNIVVNNVFQTLSSIYDLRSEAIDLSDIFSNVRYFEIFVKYNMS